MNFFVSLLSVCALVYIISVFGKDSLIRFFSQKKPNQIEESKAALFWVSLLIGGVLLYGMSPNFFFMGALLVWILGGYAVFWCGEKLHRTNEKILVQILICLLGTFGIVKFSALTFYFIPLLALGWWICWYTFAFFDKFPVTSFIVSICWSLSVLAIGVLKGFPIEIVSQGALLGITLIAFARMNLKQKIPVLGNEVANLAGFTWGCMWVYFLSKGFVIQTACMFGYYLFEALILGIAFIKKRPLKTFLACLVESPKFSSKAIRIVFSHCLILSMFGMMMLLMRGNAIYLISVFVMLVVLTDLYMRLNNLLVPLPTFRDMFTDAKKGFKLLAQQVKEKTAQKKAPPKKTSTKNKKSSSVKKVGKKNIKKRKTKK